VYHLGAKEESAVELRTMQSLPLSAAKGLSLSAAKEHDDGGRPAVGVPQANRESGMANRKQALRRELAYFTSQSPTAEPKKA